MFPLPLYANEEFGPPSPALRDRLRDELPYAPTDVLVCTANSQDRLWRLASLLIRYGEPSPHWIAEPAETLWPDNLSNEALRGALAAREPNPSKPVILSLEVPDATLLVPWSFILDHLAADRAPCRVWVAAPLDVPWILYNYYSEFLIFTRPAYSRVAELGFVSSFPVPGGPLVPKPRYFIRYGSGERWLSQKLTDPDERRPYDELFAFLAARTGTPITHLAVLPEEVDRAQQR